MSILSPEPPRRDGWAETRWSHLARLGRPDEPAGEDAWAYLAQTYRPPMERYVRRVLSRVRGRAPTPEEVQDVVQGFLAACVEKGWLDRADPERGRFRAYLQTLLKRYTYKTLRHANAQRRSPGGDRRVYSLTDTNAAEALSEEDRQDFEAFNESWVGVAVDRTLVRLAEEHERYQTILVDLVATDGEGSADMAARLAVSRSQLAVLKHRARKRFAKLFEEELAHTVGDPDAFAEEWRALQPYLVRRRLSRA